MTNDQTFYNILFSLFRAVAILAGEANDRERQRQHAIERALLLEARLHAAEAERDDYRMMLRKRAA